MEGMRKGFRQLIVLLLLVAFTAIYLNGTRIFAPPEQNSAYLTNLRYEGAGNEWNKSLFGEQARWASMENYIRLQTEYDSKRAYGLLNDADEARYHGEFRGLAMNALRDWQGYHTGKLREAVGKNLDLVPSWYAIRNSKSAPVVIAGILAAAYTGRMLQYRLSDKMSLESQTILRSARFESQYIGWTNSLLGASVGSTYDNTSHGVAMSVTKAVSNGVSVNYARQIDSDAVTMVYSTGF
jgi:hypothetical protein